MSAAAVFLGPNGQDATTAIRAEIHALTTPTVGDLLYCGQIFRARIRQRTLAGIDVNGAPFKPYKTTGPYYLYPNKSATGSRSRSGDRNFTAAQLNARRDNARATAAKNRHVKTGRIGVRTSTGIKYDSYAGAKAAHGVANVNLYGMEQHTHMLDTMLVKSGGSTVGEMESFGSELGAFEQNYAASSLQIGFYGPEAERAKGNNEGTGKGGVQREFFALNAEDLQLGEKATAERMFIRARSGHGVIPGGSGSAPSSSGNDTSRDDWISF